MKEKLLAATLAVAFGSGICTISRQQEQQVSLENDSTTQVVVPRINAALSYLENCNNPDLNQATQDFKVINEESKIAYVFSNEIGTKIIGVIEANDKQGNPQKQIGINIAEVTSAQTSDQEIAADLYEAVKQYSGNNSKGSDQIPQDC